MSQTYKWITLLILVILVHCCICNREVTDGQQAHDFEKNLRHDLQNVSEIYVMPPHNYLSPVKVAIELLIIALRDLDEKTESLTLDAWLKLKWNDTRLSWDKTMYGGLSSIKLPYHTTWHPDVKLYNRLKLSETDTNKDVLSTVQSTGEVEWILPSTFTSACSIDLKFYPFDLQTCTLTFGPWNENAHNIEMELYRPDGTMVFGQLFNENNQWEIVNNRSRKIIKYLPCCEEPYTEVNFELQLRRRSPYYKYIILIPALGVAALTLLIFWLPPQAIDKLLLSSTCFLSLVIIQLHLSLTLNTTGKTVPMIVTFCGHLTLIVVVSTAMSIVSIVWSRTEYTRPPPKWLTTHLHSFIGKILCVTIPTLPVATNHNDECISLEIDGDDIKCVAGEKERHEYYTLQWKSSLQMLDRVTFILLVVLVSFALAGSFTLNQ